MSNKTNFINELRGYQPIPRNLIEDDTLSKDARFLYCLMAVKPDDWEYFESYLKKQLHISDSRTFRKYRDELIKAGWLVSEGQQQTDNGQFSAIRYILKAKPEPDVQKMHNGEPTDVQKMPHGKKCRTAKNAQHNKKELIEHNTHSLTTHTHTTGGAELSEEERLIIGKIRQFMDDKCADLELRFQTLTDQQILTMRNKLNISGANICKLLLDIQAKQYEYCVGASLSRLIEKFWTYDFGRRKKK